MTALAAGWSRPRVPRGYDALVACPLDDGGWELDFVNETTMQFASEEQSISIAWPWETGFVPSAADWRRIGIGVLTL